MIEVRPDPDPDARRLVVASVLRLHVARTLGTGPLGDDDLVGAAAALRPADDTLARRHGLAFSPGYPGDGEVEHLPGGARLVLVCRATHRGEPAAVVVTTLIPGRVPLVTAAPPHAAPPDATPPR